MFSIGTAYTVRKIPHNIGFVWCRKQHFCCRYRHMKRGHGFPNSFTNLWLCNGQQKFRAWRNLPGLHKTHPLTKTCNYTRGENTFPYLRRTNGNVSGTISGQNSAEWMQINPEILIYLPAKGSLKRRCFKMLLFFFWKILRMLEKWKARCNFNLSNLIRSQQRLKKTAALVLTISLLNALLLTIQYTLFNTHTSTIGDVSVVCSAKDKA